jgi:phosphatidylinositol glycan class B
LIGVLVLGAAARLALALTDDGIFWPDEIFQSLEPAHRRAFGYALLPWEYVDGARSWLLPMLLAPLLRAGAALDGDRPRGYLVLMRLVFVAASVATAYGAYLAARKLRVPPSRALVAAALFALMPSAILLAPRAFSENATAPLLIFGVALLCDEAPSLRAVAAAGALFGVATILRVQNVVVCATAVGWLAARRRGRQAALLMIVLAAFALVDGGLDRITWGGWFQSARAYWYGNVTRGYAGMMGRQAATYYLRAFVSSSGAAGVLLLVLAAVGSWRARGVAAMVAVYLVAYSIVGHKELRYSLPIWPLLCTLAAVGVDELGRLRAQLAPAAAVVAIAAAAWAASTVPRLTFEDLGSAGGKARILDHGGAYNRALAATHERTDLCGLKLPTSRTESGGISWLHRRVPVYGAEDAPPADQHHYNYEIHLARDGSATIEALGFAECAPDSTYQWRGN